MPLWLESVIDFLNSNNGMITALATVVLAVITGVYVYLMKTYVRLTKKNVQMAQEMLENSYKPEVVLRLLYHRPTSVRVAPTETTQKSMIILSVKNVGPGVAYKIKFEGDLSFKPYEKGATLQRVNFLVNGIDQLVPGGERRSNSYFVGDPSGDPSELQVMITGTWEDFKGKEHCKDFYLNFSDPELPLASYS